MIIIIIIVRTWIRYDPKLDLVIQGDRRVLLLWYNSYKSWDNTIQRTYIKLFEL